jgi:uncharacterized protein with HEPN domain
MSKHDDLVRLRHMLDAARKIREFSEGHTRQTVEADEKLVFALLHLLEILGEAANSVSPELQQQHPNIPWREITGTRNRLIHAYFDVDLNRVWHIVQTDLPPLITQLEQIVPPDTSSPA